jgi:hypothetical protein
MPERAHELHHLRSGTRWSVVDRDPADRIHAGRSAAREHADVGASADHRDALHRVGPQRQQAAPILQQHDAALRDALRDGKARRRVDRARRLVAIERAHRGEAAQNAARHVVDAPLGNLAALDGFFQCAREIARLVELLVEAGIRRSGRAVGRAPVGDDPALEAPFALHDAVEKFRVLAGVDAVQPVVGAHHAADARFLHGDLEWQEIDLAQRALVSFHVDPMAIGLLGVGDEVLDGGYDPLRLDAAQLRRHQACGQDRVLSEVLEVASVPGVALDGHTSREQLVEPANARFAAHDPPARLSQLDVEGRGERLRGGESSCARVGPAADVSHAQRPVVELNRGNAEPRQSGDEAGSAARAVRRRPPLVRKPECSMKQVDLFIEGHRPNERVGTRVRVGVPVRVRVARVHGDHD